MAAIRQAGAGPAGHGGGAVLRQLGQGLPAEGAGGGQRLGADAVGPLDEDVGGQGHQQADEGAQHLGPELGAGRCAEEVSGLEHADRDRRLRAGAGGHLGAGDVDRGAVRAPAGPSRSWASWPSGPSGDDVGLADAADADVDEGDRDEHRGQRPARGARRTRASPAAPPPPPPAPAPTQRSAGRRAGRAAGARRTAPGKRTRQRTASATSPAATMRAMPGQSSQPTSEVYSARAMPARTSPGPSRPQATTAPASRLRPARPPASTPALSRAGLTPIPRVSAWALAPASVERQPEHAGHHRGAAVAEPGQRQRDSRPSPAAPRVRRRASSEEAWIACITSAVAMPLGKGSGSVTT